MNDKAIQTIDHETGEVIEDETSTDLLVIGTDAVMESLEQGTYPLFMRKLDELDMDAEDKEALLSCYTGGAIRLLKMYSGEEINVLGAAILYHGPYKGKDGYDHLGYYFNAILTDAVDERGAPIVLRSSSASLMLHLAYALKNRGWFLWEKPVKYKITLGEDGSHRMVNMDRRADVLSRKRTKKEGK